MVYSGWHLTVKYVSIMFLQRVFLIMVFSQFKFCFKICQQNRQRTQTPNKQQQQKNNQKKHLKLMSLNPAPPTGLWLGWVQWKALVESQRKLAALPGQPPPCVGMAPRLQEITAAAVIRAGAPLGHPNSSLPVPRKGAQRGKVSGCELEDNIFWLDIRKKLFLRVYLSTGVISQWKCDLSLQWDFQCWTRQSTGQPC